MTHEDLVCHYLNLASAGDDPDTNRILADIASQSVIQLVL